MPGRRLWWLFAATFAAAVAGCCAFSGPRYAGPPSAHFDGAQFLNQEPLGKGPLDFLRWQASRSPGHWRHPGPGPVGPRPPRRVREGELRVTWVGHATVLVQMDGLNILTDPIWSERASPVSFAGPRRVRPPGIRFEDLPPIDVVLVSHNHYDHCDLPTLVRLAREHRPRVVVGLGNGALLDANDIPEGIELDWWERIPLSANVRLTMVPARHFSMRGLCDRDATLWGGYVIEGPAGAVYFSGDTGYGDHFRRIGERFGPLRLALLPIGAYRPQSFMAPAHISPEDALRAHRELGAATSVAIHFGTFPLADDGEDEPVADLTRALARTPEAQRGRPLPRFWTLEPGEGRRIPEVARP